jgi:hypothetical protein
MTTPPDPPNPEHKRRPRYRGTHPRKFEERYKELAHEKYPDIVPHILAKGRTPAGQHVPIMVEEVLAALAPAAGERAADCTLGYGGHARRILERITPGGMLVGLDADPIELPRTEARLRAAGHGEDVFVVRRSNFAGLHAVLQGMGWSEGIDVVLADLGVSSMQIDDPTRGFTFGADGPLDMRMNPSRGLSAAQWLERTPTAAIAEALRDEFGRALRRGHRGGTRATSRASDHDVRARRHRARGGRRGRLRGRGRAERAARVPGAAHRGERRVRRARFTAARPALVLATGRSRRDPVIPFGRGSAREEGLPGGRARRAVRRGRRRGHPRDPTGAPRQPEVATGQAALGETRRELSASPDARTPARLSVRGRPSGT